METIVLLSKVIKFSVPSIISIAENAFVSLRCIK